LGEEFTQRLGRIVPRECEGASEIPPQLSSPAKAGDPVFQSKHYEIESGVLDAPLSRGMTT
jgi:hypothetical protein